MLYDVPAPAKINLFLHVLGRRADGYHLLQTAFRFISLSDTLHFDMRADGGIGRAAELPDVAACDDLTLRAAHALKRATGTNAGVQITLEKRIPTGGGLGGGSSDAASVLIALNRLWNTGLSRAELMRLGLSLGADVPVFIFGQSALGEGVGEDLTAIALAEAGYVVAQPDASVPTAVIFSNPRLTRDTKYIKITGLASEQNHLQGSGFKSAGLKSPEFKSPEFKSDLRFKNDLEGVVFDLYPEVRQARDWLQSRLKDVNVRMSGSGACLFAEYNDFEQAALAVQEIVATMRVSDRLYMAEDETPVEGQTKVQGRFRLLQAFAGLTEHPLRRWIAD